jgi:hypothetical protein
VSVPFETTVRHDYVLDEMIDAYVDWRERSRGVWQAYHHWLKAPAEDGLLRFAAYLAELDQEQRACDVYQATIARIVERL